MIGFATTLLPHFRCATYNRPNRGNARLQASRFATGAARTVSAETPVVNQVSVRLTNISAYYQGLAYAIYFPAASFNSLRRMAADPDEFPGHASFSGRSLGPAYCGNPGCAGSSALPFQSIGFRSSHHQLRWRQYQLQGPRFRSA